MGTEFGENFFISFFPESMCQMSSDILIQHPYTFYLTVGFIDLLYFLVKQDEGQFSTFTKSPNQEMKWGPLLGRQREERKLTGCLWICLGFLMHPKLPYLSPCHCLFLPIYWSLLEKDPWLSCHSSCLDPIESMLSALSPGTYRRCRGMSLLWSISCSKAMLGLC